MPVGPQQLRHVVLAGLLDIHGGQGITAHGPQAGPGPGQPLPDERVVRGAVALRELGQVGKLTRVTDLLPQRRNAALEGQRSHRDAPAVARLADHQVGVGAGVVEEHLVELRGAGDLDDRPDLHARLVQRHQQIRQAGVALGALLGAGHHEAPLRQVRERRPHLLAIDVPLLTLAVELGGSGHVGQVAAGAGLRISLAPQLGDVEDARQEALLLLGCSERDQRRPEQFLAEVVDLVRRVGAGVLLVERHPVRGGKPTAAVLDRPPQAGQPGLGEVLVPGPAFFEGLVLASWSAEPLERCEFADEIVGEPLADLGPELLDVLHAL